METPAPPVLGKETTAGIVRLRFLPKDSHQHNGPASAVTFNGLSVECRVLNVSYRQIRPRDYRSADLNN